VYVSGISTRRELMTSLTSSLDQNTMDTPSPIPKPKQNRTTAGRP
jgi:hypothetical protein